MHQGKHPKISAQGDPNAGTSEQYPWKASDLRQAKAAIRNRPLWKHLHMGDRLVVVPVEQEILFRYTQKNGWHLDQIAKWIASLDQDRRPVYGHLARILAVLGLLSITELPKDLASPENLANAIIEGERQRKLLGRLLKGSQFRPNQRLKNSDHTIRAAEFHGADFLDAVVNFVSGRLHASGRCPNLSRTEIFQKIASVLDQVWQDPVDILDGAIDALNLDEAGVSRPPPPKAQPTHWICKEFERFLAEYPKDDSTASLAASRDDIEEIVKDFVQTAISDSPRCVLLHGREEGGKKMVAGEFVAHYARPDARKTRVFHPTKGDLALPIFVENCQQNDLWSLMIAVVVFLEAQETSAGLTTQKHATKELEKMGRSREIEKELKKRIAEAHKKHPAMFIFLDAENPERSRFTRALHGTDITPLIELLYQTNEKSCFLLTSSELSEQTWPLSKNWVKPRDISPHGLDAWAWYLAHNTENRKAAEAVSRPFEIDGIWGEKTKIPGDILAVMAQCFELSRDDEPAMSALRQSFERMIKALPDEPTSESALCNARSELYTFYIDRLNALGLLELAAILAGVRYDDDAIVQSTINDCLQQLGVKKRDLTKDLDRLTGRTMIATIQAPHTDREEELETEERSEGLLYRFSRSVARQLVRTLETHPNHANLMRRVHHKLARRANERAVQKRINRPHSNRFLDPMDHRRDAQSAMHLMASASEVPQDSQLSYNNEPIRLIAEDIYNAHTPPSAQIAARYIYHALLRDGIDAGFRLSMQLDLDELRLKQFLLLLLPPGRMHPWSISDIRDRGQCDEFALPTEVPGWLIEAIGDEQVCKCLLSIALAAYHAQAPKLVQWAFEVYQSHMKAWFDREGIKLIPVSLRATHGRMIAVVIDAALATGDSPVSGCKGYGFEEIRAWGEAERAAFLDATGFAVGTSLTDSECKDTRRAFLRVEARLCDAAWLADGSSKAVQKRYETLIDSECAYHEIDTRSGPIVRSGRSGRRYIRFLLDEYAVLPPPNDTRARPKPDRCHEASRVVSANVVRLNSHAGAERIGVLLDKARIAIARGNPGLAEGYMRTAQRQREETPVSPAMRTEILSMQAATEIWRHEASQEGAPEDWSLHKVISEIRELSGRYNLKPSEMLSYFLEGRQYILLRHHKPKFIGDARRAFRKAQEKAQQIGAQRTASLAEDWIAFSKRAPDR